jgi:hypothetical protein
MRWWRRWLDRRHFRCDVRRLQLECWRIISARNHEHGIDRNYRIHYGHHASG